MQTEYGMSVNGWRRVAAAGAVLGLVAQAEAGLLHYEGQTASATYVNTAYNAKGLHYTYANGKGTMLTTGGKRTTPGSGDPAGCDYFDLSPAAGGAWDLAGLYDAGSGTIGGGNVEGVLYVSVLVRSYAVSDGTSENKGAGTQGMFGGFDLLRGATDLLGLGNEWSAWAFSIYGAVTGKKDLVQAAGGTTYLNVDKNTHLLVARIAFHAGAADDLSVWLDPDPDNGDTQLDAVRRFIGAAQGDLSFNRIGYRSGNIPAVNSWDFDEVRFGTDWASITPRGASAPLWYDGQGPHSTFVNTAYNPSGLMYTLVNAQPLPTSGGKRTTPGTGDPAGNDFVNLYPAAGSGWDLAGLYDAGTGLVGGGDVGGVLYMSALLKAYYPSDSATSERKTGALPYGTYAGVGPARAGTQVLGLGNGWEPHAYSFFDTVGASDLVFAAGGATWLTVNTAVHLLVARITFKAGVNDEVTVWLDPNPDNGDTQIDTVRRGARNGDASFNQVAYRSGDIPGWSGWDFDEVRFATDWRGVLTDMPSSGTVFIVR